MRPNRFFTDLDTSASIQWLTKESLNDCSEDYILQRIKKCDGREEMRVYSYESSCSHSMDLLRSLYLRGDSIESLRPVYLQARERLRLLEESIHACGMEKAKMDIIYPVQMGLLLALGHALGESRDEIGRNTRAMSAGYDLFIDRLLSIYDPTRPLADDINHKPVYKSLYAVFDAPPDKRPGMIARYLDQWEKLLLKNKIPLQRYPVTERLQHEWRGFWCYPAAAVVASTGKNRSLNNPEPNTVYCVDGRHKYTTDADGRTTNVTSTITEDDLDTGVRNCYQQGKVGSCVLDDDEGGHLIATKLGGPGEKINLVPQNMNLNRGNWKRMENRWAKAAAEGKKVEVDIDVIYDVDSQRPKSFIVTETIDGVISDTPIRFINQAGG